MADRAVRTGRLACPAVVAGFVEQGLVTLTRDAGESGQPPVDVSAGQPRSVLADPANWWLPDGVRPIALAPAAQGLAVYRGLTRGTLDAGRAGS